MKNGDGRTNYFDDNNKKQSLLIKDAKTIEKIEKMNFNCNNKEFIDSLIVKVENENKNKLLKKLLIIR